MTHQKPILILLFILAISLLANLFGLNRLLIANRDLTRLVAETADIKQIVREIKDQPNKNDEVSSALAKLREELVAYRAEQVGRDQILGLSNSSAAPAEDPYANLTMSLDEALATIEKQIHPTATPTPSSQIKLQSNWTSIDAYEQPKAGSRILGQIRAQIPYPFIAKQNGWYQVELENGALAWVQSQFVYEIN